MYYGNEKSANNKAISFIIITNVDKLRTRSCHVLCINDMHQQNSLASVCILGHMNLESINLISLAALSANVILL